MPISKDANPAHSLGEVVQELRTLFEALDKRYNTSTPVGRSMIMVKAIEAIKNKPALKGGIANALKDGTAPTIEVAVSHPVLKVVMTNVKSLIQS